MDVIGSAIFYFDIFAWGDIDIDASGVGECLSDTALWPAGNDQLELLQVVDLNPPPKRT